MEIKVVLTADDKLTTLLQSIATALTASSLTNVTNVVQAAVEEEHPKKATKQKKAETKVDEPKAEVQAEPELQEEPQADQEAETEPEATVSEPDPKADHGITDVQIRAEAQKLAKSGRQKELKAIFETFIGKDGNPVEKLSNIKEADYPAVLAKIHEVLGVK